MTAEPPLVGLDHLYDCLGITGDVRSATGTMPLGPHAPSSSALAASFGLLLEQTCFLPLASSVSAVPIDIAVDVLDDGAGADTALATVLVLRRGRSLATTAGRIVAADDPSRLLALGTLTWSILGAAKGAPAASVGHPAISGDALAALGVTSTGPGRCELRAFGPSLSGPGGVLHAGAYQLLAEAAARSAVGGGAVTHLALRFLTAAREAPFAARATVEGQSDRRAICSIAVHDEGGTRLVSHGIAHVAPR